MRIIKIGGNELNNADFLTQLGATIAAFTEPVVIVHGGGKAIADLQTALGQPIKKVDGLRVTDADGLRITEMILSGQSNKTVVRALLAADVAAVGISGVDTHLLQASKKQHPSADLGFVGEIVNVRPKILHHLIEGGFTPVVSPVSLGDEGQHYNINADEAAAAIAIALNAEQLDFVSNVPGVLHDGEIRPNLSLEQAEQLIEQSVITDGMIPKVRSALNTVEQGVQQVRIVNLAGLGSDAGTIFTKSGEFA